MLAKSGMLWMSCITPLHNGAGETVDYIDRPIIRERHTGLPFVQSSSLKGVFRAHCKTKWETSTQCEHKLNILFGTMDNTGDKNIGFLDFVDAYLFTMPIRSLVGGYALLTCPMVLRRLQQFAKQYTHPIDMIDPLMKITRDLATHQDHVLVTSASENLLAYKGKVFLEEYPLKAYKSENPAFKEFGDLIGNVVYSDDDSMLKDFTDRLVVVSDTMFTYFTRFGTEIQANIRIGKNGVTEEGSLRYSEYLPQESLMFIPFQARCPFKKDPYASANDVFDAFKEIITDERLQVGGDETTGKGIVTFALHGDAISQNKKYEVQS